MGLRNGGAGATNRIALRTYISEAVATGPLTGSEMSFTLTDFPENIQVLGGHVVIDGEPVSGGTTTGLHCRVGTDAEPTKLGTVAILDKSGRLALSNGLNGVQAVKLTLVARIEPDDPGDLADIDGLVSISVVLYYVLTGA
jgi:hypothetical protein